jgi:UDP-N-acetylmuramate: L-alanyl-gamma-D-glutamyl-meso-diaminopimelate ligase
MHIHILGIAGTMTAPLAVKLKQLGHQVSGSDQDKIYPPISTILKKAKIKTNFFEITPDIDLSIVGSSYNSFKNTKKEFQQIKKLNIPYISATDYIAQNIVKKESIVVAGSFGKTTITSLLSWIFLKAKKNPSYMFGGEPKNKYPAIAFSSSDFSVIEGDESIHGLDKQAKFLSYSPKYLILTSADWEHKDCYPSEAKNFNAFKKLTQTLPKDGLMVVNYQSLSAKKISQFSNSPVITYNSPQANYFIDKIKIKDNLTTLIINTPNGLIKIDTQLIGQFNFENILASVALCDCLKIKKTIIQKAIFSYKGIKRRLDLVANYKNILFFDDFAQSPSRIKSTLLALKNHYPDKSIKVFYLAHASFNQYKNSLGGLDEAFKPAKEIVLGPLKYNSKIDKKNRITANDFKLLIGSKLNYLPLKRQILKYYKSNLIPNDIFIYMSSGGFDNNRIFKSIIKSFKN